MAASWLAGVCVVVVETSNVCPYTSKHPRCPRAVLTDPVTWLEESVILRTFAELGEAGYDGVVVLSQYSDPLADPRMFSLMDALRDRKSVV